MTLVELHHPEDLLDKEAHGSLSSDERERLDAHLERCIACAFERSVRDDLRLELRDQDESLRFQLLITGALAATPSADSPPAGSPPSDLPPAGLLELTASQPDSLATIEAPHVVPDLARLPDPPATEAPRPSWPRRPVALLTAALLLASGAAAAHTETASRIWNFSRNEIATALGFASPAAPSLPLAAQPAISSALAPGRLASVPPSPAAVGTSVDSTLSTSTPPSTTAPASPSLAATATAPAPAATTVSRVEPRPASAERAGAPAASVEAPADGEPPVTAASLFERASAARRQGRAGEAMTLYQQLQARFGASAEARLAVALLARMHLDQGNASAALAGYDAYLRSGHGALREEAMAGRALALGRLGQQAPEQAAWAALLAAFPRTSYAALAARRMGTTP